MPCNYFVSIDWRLQCFIFDVVCLIGLFDVHCIECWSILIRQYCFVGATQTPHLRCIHWLMIVVVQLSLRYLQFLLRWRQLLIVLSIGCSIILHAVYNRLNKNTCNFCGFLWFTSRRNVLFPIGNGRNFFRIMRRRYTAHRRHIGDISCAWHLAPNNRHR